MALLGENGAGKSTVSNIISGRFLPSLGSITLQGAPYAPGSSRATIDAGVGMIHQEMLLLPHLSIAENIFVGRYPMRAVRVDRSELVRAIAGADPITPASITLNGTDITPKSPKDAINNGIVLVPEDRKLQGVVLDHAIRDNIAYSNLDTVSNRGWISKGRVETFASESIKKFGVNGVGHQQAGEMPGGNQQKVVIAKWLARDPRVVLLDEPTRGIDVGARSSIYEIIHRLAAAGVAVIVVSSDLE